MASAVLFRDAVSLVGRFPVLAGLSLEVGEGEALHLRGPNGAGKTSILRACAGLLPIVSGSAVVLGHDLLSDRTSVRRQVAHLGHKTFLYDDLTVEENARFALRAARAPVGRLEQALERFSLDGRLRRTLVGRLSAGQRRRAALAIVDARRAPLWLLDEPHAGLDEDARQQVDELIGEARAGGCTVVFASHEHGRAEAVATRAVEVRGGAATPAERPHIAPVGEEGADLDVA